MLTESNMLYVESPIGVGFLYSNTGSIQLYFLEWFEIYCELASRISYVVIND